MFKYSMIKILEVLNRTNLRMSMGELQQELEKVGFITSEEELRADLRLLQEKGLIQGWAGPNASQTKETMTTDSFSVTPEGRRKVQNIVRL